MGGHKLNIMWNSRLDLKKKTPEFLMNFMSNTKPHEKKQTVNLDSGSSRVRKHLQSITNFKISLVYCYEI